MPQVPSTTCDIHSCLEIQAESRLHNHKHNQNCAWGKIKPKTTCVPIKTNDELIFAVGEYEAVASSITWKRTLNMRIKEYNQK